MLVPPPRGRFSASYWSVASAREDTVYSKLLSKYSLLFQERGKNMRDPIQKKAVVVVRTQLEKADNPNNSNESPVIATIPLR